MINSKLTALAELIHQARAQRGSRASLLRLRKAGAVLGLSDDEQRELEVVLEYRPFADQDVYAFYLTAGRRRP